MESGVPSTALDIIGSGGVQLRLWPPDDGVSHQGRLPLPARGCTLLTAGSSKSKRSLRYASSLHHLVDPAFAYFCHVPNTSQRSQPGEVQGLMWAAAFAEGI
jgi:hypothetical protein